MLPGLLILVVLAAALGTVLLILGLRGRRVDDHPICRRCSFDLVGVYPGAERCPECGSELADPRSVRDGARRRRRAVLVAAIPLLAVGFGGGGALGWLRATNHNWYSIAPDWVLEEWASSPNGSRQAAALDELATRLAADELHGPRADRLIVQGLAAQADEQTPWLLEWGDVLEAGLQSGRFSPEQFVAYVTNGIDCVLGVRERVREGEESSITMYVSPARLGPNVSGTVAAEWGEIEIDGSLVVPVEEWRKIGFRFIGAGSMASSVRALVITEALGEHELAATSRVTVTLTSAPGAFAARPVRFSESPSASFEIVPAGTALVEFVDDPSIAAQMASAITVPRLEVTPGGEGGMAVRGGIRYAGLPMPFACDVYIRDKEGELHLWRRVCLLGGMQAEIGFTETLPLELGDAADVVFLASERAALTLPGFDLSWDGEVVLEAVPVTRPPENTGD